MLYLKQGQVNEIIVTWTQREKDTDAAWYILELTHLGTKDVFRFSLLKSSNLSSYKERYDHFEITLPTFFQQGQFKYVAYESTSSVITDKIGIVETGLAQVELVAEDFARYELSTNYAEYASSLLDYLADENDVILSDEITSLLINVGDPIPKNTMADENHLPIIDELNQYIIT